MFHEMEDKRVGLLNVVRSPFAVDGEFFHSRRPNAGAPGLGEHTRELLAELNYSNADIEKLVDDRVVVSRTGQTSD